MNLCPLSFFKNFLLILVSHQLESTINYVISIFEYLPPTVFGVFRSESLYFEFFQWFFFQLLLVKFLVILFYVHECFACIYVHVPLVCLVPTEAERRCEIAWY